MKRPRRVAFVVGNSDYEGADKLPNAVNDAREIGSALRRLGFVVSGGTGGAESASPAGENLDQDAMVERFGAFLDTVSEGDEAVVYYSGHGLQIDDENYLVPLRAKLDAEVPLGAKLVPLREWLERVAVKAGPAGKVVALLDACREQPFSPAQLRSLAKKVDDIDSGRGLELGYTKVDHGFAAMKITPGPDAARTFIAFATAPGEVAYDGTGAHSPFAAGFLDHVGTPGLELDELFNRVGLDVHDRVGLEEDRLTPTGRYQDPWRETNLKEDFYFNPPTWRPVRDMTLLGLLAGLVSCWALLDAKGVLLDSRENSWLLVVGVLFAAVVFYGTMKWGSRRWRDAAFAFFGTWLAFVLALEILQTRVEGVPVTQAVNVGSGIPTLAEIVKNARFVANSLLAHWAGMIFAVGTALACKPQLGVFRGFSAPTGAVVVGMLLAVVFVLFVWFKNQYGLPPGPLMIGLGALWFGILGFQLGYCFAHYVPEHRRIARRANWFSRRR